MKKFLVQQENRWWWCSLFLAVVAGVFLRSYLFGSQVLIDDEWHGVYYVIGKSPFWLLTHFSIPGATCIPLNFYTYVLAATVGLNEIWLRLPSLACGVACILVGPLLARKMLGTSRAAWFAWFLATSPLLVFYSRLCRPYSAVALLGVAAVLLAAQWRQTGNRLAAAGFAFTGVLAVYFHLFAAVTVAAPVLAALAAGSYRRWVVRRPASGEKTTIRGWLLVAGAMALLGAVLVLPALIHSMQTTFFNIAGAGTLQLQSVPKAVALLAGTGSPILILLVGVLFVAGAIDLWRRDAWLAGTLISLYPLHVLALLVSRPDCAQAAIVLVRYCIPLVPVTLMLIACGLEAVFEMASTHIALRPAMQGLIGGALVTFLVSAGPLPQTYVAPNNFTSHGAFQHNYATIDWHESFRSDLAPPDSKLVTAIRVEEVSPFYGELAKAANGRPIVEYPMLVGDHFNPFYYYQHFHRRPVIVGYASDVFLDRGLAAGNIYGNTYIDQILSLEKPQSILRFRNLINMDDLGAMRTRGVEYVILHKRFEAELPQVTLPLPDLERLNQAYRAALGAPAYEDSNIVVFRL